MVEKIEGQSGSISDRQWWKLRSFWDKPMPDIFLKSELVDYFMVTHKINGYVHLDISLKGEKTIDGWIPETYIS